MSRYGTTQHTTFSGTEACAVPIEEIPAVVASLRAAFDSDKTLSLQWRKGQLEALKRMMTEGRDELAAAMKIDLHKSAFECWATELSLVVSECEEALAHLDEWAAPQYTRTSALNWPAASYTVRDPLGVVHVMGAWNYPVQLTLAPVVGAIAGGNCVLIRPGSYAVETSHAICRLVDKYMDKECIRCTEGDRHLTAKILQERFDLFVFTGSEFVGKLVAEAAAKNLTPTILELGGKSPTIVDKSAHVQHAAERIAWATFLNGGQTCVRPDFCLVHEQVADEFLGALKATIRSFYGKRAERSEDYGRIINPKAFERLEDLLNKHRQAVVCGGGADAASRFIEPTVFDFGPDLDAFAKQSIMQDEIFGPLLPVARYSSIEDVVSFVRRLPTGKPLALYCYARDRGVIDTISRRTTSGGLCINDSVMHLANHDLPFGGVGRSGMGNYHGHHSFQSFTHEKAVLRKYPLVDQMPGMKTLLAARFPPYTSFKKLAVNVFGSRPMSWAVNLPNGAVGEAVGFAKNVAGLYVLSRLCGIKTTVERGGGGFKLVVRGGPFARL